MQIKEISVKISEMQSKECEFKTLFSPAELSFL